MVLLLIDLLALEDRGEEEAPAVILLNNLCCLLVFALLRIEVKVRSKPRDGGAEKLKLQDAIPPFFLIEDSIHGKKAAMLVKTA